MGSGLPKANTQYGDMKGTSALDWQKDDIHSLARAIGVDTSRYFPVGVQFHGMDLENITIFAVDTSMWSERSFDAVQTYVTRNGGSLPVTGFSGRVPHAELKKYVKRFSVVLISKFRGLTDLEIAEPEEDDEDDDVED